MRRAALILLALLLVPVAPAAAAADTAPRLRAALTACTTGAQPAQRTASFTGSMPALPDTVRMAMRFDLQQRTADGGVWQRVAASGLGRWERSRPRVSGFVYAKTVDGLAAPAEYRAVVRFRWFAQDGTVQSARRVTRLCRQPDVRPDLVPRALTTSPGPQPATTTYSVVVRNRGRGDAGAFAVALALDGAELARTDVAEVPAGGRVVVQLTGPVCAAGQSLEVRVDASAAVDESREDDDVLTRACPLVTDASG
jgi:hypothetical protein